MNELAVNSTAELPGAGTAQSSGASQAAAANLDTSQAAAPESAATRLYEKEGAAAAQQQAPEGNESLPDQPGEAAADKAPAPPSIRSMMAKTPAIFNPNPSARSMADDS